MQAAEVAFVHATLQVTQATAMASAIVSLCDIVGRDETPESGARNLFQIEEEIDLLIEKWQSAKIDIHERRREVQRSIRHRRTTHAKIG